MPVAPEQWPLLRKIRLRALADAPAAFVTTLAQAQMWTDAQWQSLASREPGTWVAFADGVPSGMVAAQRSASVGGGGAGSAAELLAFWVAPEQRGRGVGRKLVEAVEAWALGSGVGELHAYVYPSNAAATRFYERLDFRAAVNPFQDPADPHTGSLLLVLGCSAGINQQNDAAGI